MLSLFVGDIVPDIDRPVLLLVSMASACFAVVLTLFFFSRVVRKYEMLRGKEGGEIWVRSALFFVELVTFLA
jgi:hypothetical protein